MTARGDPRGCENRDEFLSFLQQPCEPLLSEEPTLFQQFEPIAGLIGFLKDDPDL